MSVASNVAHHVVSHAIDPLISLTVQRWALEGASSFWASFLQIATVIVVLGVVVEVVATILEVRDEFAEGKPAKVHHILTFVGGALVVLAVAGEYWAESKSASIETELRKNNAAAQGELDKRAREATAAAVGIAQKFGGLRTLVSTKEGEIEGTFAKFRSFADAEKKLTAHEIGELAHDKAQLDKARDDAVASLAAAQKIAADMGSELQQERALRERYAKELTPRQIDDAHFAALVTGLKAYPKTSVDIALTRDPDSGDLMVRITDAFKAAGWDIRPCTGPGFGLRTSARPDLPNLCELTARGVQLHISDADIKFMEAPGNALILGLVNAGIDTFPSVDPDKLPDGKPSPNAVPHGVLHVVIGAKP